MIWKIIIIVFASGCIGGFISGFFYIPKMSSKFLFLYEGEVCGTKFPGIVTNTLLGGVAAVIFWCLYGPYIDYSIIGNSPNLNNLGLTLGQLASCFLIGMGGAGFLQSEANKRCYKEQIPS